MEGGLGDGVLVGMGLSVGRWLDVQLVVLCVYYAKLQEINSGIVTIELEATKAIASVKISICG